MWYKCVLVSRDNKRYRLSGKKVIKSDRIGETGVSDTTTLFVDILEGEEENGMLIASGIMKISLADFAAQLNTLDVINTSSQLEQLKWTAKFGKFFADTIWHVYSGLADCNYLDPSSPPRKKRPLRLRNATPIVYKVLTGDNVSAYQSFFSTISFFLNSHERQSIST